MVWGHAPRASGIEGAERTASGHLIAFCIIALCSFGANQASAAQQGSPLQLLTPDSFEVGGPNGGPFAPASRTFAIRNAGSSNVSWSVTSNAAWITLSNGGGTLAPGSTSQVIADVNDQLASTFDNGHTPATLTFRDLTNNQQVAAVPADLWIGVAIENSRWLRVNGKKFFPIFFWNQPPTASSVDYMRSLGSNAMMNGQNSTHTQTDLQLLDLCANRGMYAILRHNSAVADHPALLNWLTSDEPIHNGRTADSVRAEVQAIKAYDPDGIVMTNETGAFSPLNPQYNSSDVPEYSALFNATDICSFDFYPVTGWDRPLWINRTGGMVEDLRIDYAHNAKPTVVVIECSDQRLSWTPPQTRGPSPQETRFQVWSSIIHGATGIGYFSIAFNPFVWNNLTPEMEQELARTNRQIQALKEVILSTPPTLQIAASEQNGQAIEWTLRRRGSTYFLIAANADMNRNSATVTFNFGQPISSVEVWRSQDSVTPVGNSFTDHLGPLQVRIYLVRL